MLTIRSLMITSLVFVLGSALQTCLLHYQAIECVDAHGGLWDQFTDPFGIHVVWGLNGDPPNNGHSPRWYEEFACIRGYRNAILRGKHVTDQDMQVFSHLLGLRNCYLEELAISSQGIRFIPNSVVLLSLDGIRIDNHVTEVLSKNLYNLETLYLANTTLPHEVLAKLGGCQQLKKVSLFRVAVVETDLQQFRRCYPGVELVVEKER